MISEHQRAGRRLSRVHVFVEPLTNYLRYELAAYERNGAAGEEIGVVPVSREEDWPADLPREYDFWLFDDTDVWLMEYDDAGRFLEARRVTEPGRIAQCRKWRDAALARSIPHGDYTALGP